MHHRVEPLDGLEMKPKLREAFDEVSHFGARASSLSFRMRSRNGRMSAARS